MCTPGCHGNRGRPHKLVGEQKTQRPSSAEGWREKGRDGEKNQISFFSRGWGSGGGTVACTRRGKINIRRWWERMRRGGGWMDGAGETSS